MPSTSSRSTRRTARAVPVRTSPRPAPGRGLGPSAPSRPLSVPFAAAFGFLVAAEDGYLGWLLWDTRAWYVAGAGVLAAAAVAGAVLTLLGRGRGWLVLALASVVPMLALLALVLLFGALGGGSAVGQGLLLLIGPVGCLALALQRPVREWSSPARPRRSPGGRRTGRRSR